MKMKLAEVYLQIINEILDFDKIKSYDYKWSSSNVASFDTPEGLDIEIKFDDVTSELSDFEFLPFLQGKVKSLTNISFTVKGEHTKAADLNLKAYLPIMLTVRNTIENWMKTNDPECVSIISVGRENEFMTDSSKSKVYEMMVTKYPIAGYIKSKIVWKPTNMEGFCLYNSSLKHKKVQK